MRGLALIRRVSAALTLLFLVLLVTTGWALMAGFAPSDREAFDSLLYLRQAGGGGSLARSLHYHLASAVVVTGFLYLLATYLAGDHRSRRILWWSALSAYLVLLGLCFTGFLLPMDQNAYWGTVVRLGIVESSPVVGPMVADLLRGGTVINAATLPRFFALHVSLLPLLAGVALWPVLTKLATRSAGRRWWIRWLGLALLVALAALVFAAGRPAPLQPRADPTDASYIPRPEWYFLWLFQVGKYVEAVPWVRSLVLPLLGLGFLFTLPWTGGRRTGVRVTVAALWCSAWLALTGMALYEDRDLPPKLGYEEFMAVRVKEVYRDVCRDCHGSSGRGDGPRAISFGLEMRDLTDRKFWRETPESDLFGAIHDGMGKDMPAFGRQLDDEEIEALISFLRRRFGPGAL